MPSKLDQTEYIKRAKQLHPSLSYSTTIYTNAKNKIRIECPEHGGFEQLPFNHLKGVGCPQCGIKIRSKKLTLNTKGFIEKANKVHQGKYNYSKVEYNGFNSKVKIICSKHGEFEQRANNHLAGYGCYQCGLEKQNAAKWDNRGSFIKKAHLVHGNYYEYEQVNYQGARIPIEIFCKEHGYFWQNPVDHLQGKGCFECGIAKRNLIITGSQEEFIQQAKIRHANEYDYSQVCYSGFHTQVTIICKEHGSFFQSPAHHLRGHGCPTCGLMKVSLNQRTDPQEFIDKCKNTHRNIYDYSKTKYTRSQDKVEIICPKPNHGPFWQLAYDHLDGHGCPTCVHIYSQPHKNIEAHITSLGVTFYSNTRSVIAPLELDIWIPSHNLAIEFNGRYYHSLDGTEPPSAKYRHRDKFNLCQQKRILLLQIDEHEWDNPVTREVWKSVASSKLGKHTRIPARKTIFKPISSIEANAFLAVNHLQGATPALRWAFGLFYNDELVGVITYCYHQHTQINLSRLAFKLNTTIVGGAHKLFKNSLLLLPVGDIVSFSNNQYSDGAIYKQLGFTKTADLQPSYQWYFKGRIWNKRSLRKSQLAKVLPNFNPIETEHQNLYRNGARCLYDAGYQRWEYKKSAI